jgi:methylated-DNA-protein-cysteine methyltransferase-like protein
MGPEFDAAVRAALAQVPAGKVVSYGQLAELAGYARRARHVGHLLARLPEDSGLPWQRVVKSDGAIAPRLSGHQDWQRILLEEEGVPFKADGRVDMRQARWMP